MSIEVQAKFGSFEIVWSSVYGVEVIDEAETEEEAAELVAEYIMAFGEAA